MEFPKPQSSADFEAGMSVMLALFGFLAFWWAQTSPGVKRYFINRWGAEKGQEFKIYFQRAVGVVSFGVLPGVVLFSIGDVSWKDYGIYGRFTWFDSATTLLLSVLAFFMARAGAQKSDSKAMYPEIKTAVWNRKLIFRSFFYWFLYLCAYEVMFRGYLLFACERGYGAWSAVVINTAIYSLVHVPKRLTEGVGAIFLGIILCFITLYTRTIWVALLVHLVLAWSTEWYALRFHPTIRLERKIPLNH